MLGILADTQKFFGWAGGTFGAEFLQFDGQDSNQQAGTVQGYNSLPGAPPLNRSELYQLWYQQLLFNGKLIVKVGKTVPTYDFDNVVKPVALSNDVINIPAVSGLIYTPLFVNPTTFNVIPGFYNSAYGLTVSYLPTKQWYFSFGMYDGNLANGTQTGLKVGPTLNGNYFYIGETDVSWLLGKQNKPGTIGVGTSLSWLNQNTYVNPTEVMFQAYYQAKIMTGVYLEPVLSYIPDPGASADLPPTWAGTLRLIVLF